MKNTKFYPTNTKLWRSVSVCLLAWLMSIGFTFGQKQDERKLELVVQGDITSFGGAFALSADSRQIANIWGNKVVLSDINSGKVLRFFSDPWGNPNSLTISPDSKLLVAGFVNRDTDGKIGMWNLLTGAKVALPNSFLESTGTSFDGFKGTPLEIKFSPNGKFLAVSTTTFIVLYDLTGGGIIHSQKLDEGFNDFTNEGYDYLARVSFSPNSDYLLLYGSRIFQLVSTNSSKISSYPVKNRRELGKTGVKPDPSISVNNDGEFLLGVIENKITIDKFIWNKKLDEGEFRRRYSIEKNYSSVFFNAQNQKEIFISQSGVIIKRNLKTNKETFIKLEGAKPGTTAISADGKILSNGSQIWDSATGRKIRDFSENLDKNEKTPEIGSIYLDFIQKYTSPPEPFSYFEEEIQSNNVKFSFGYDSIIVEFKGRTSFVDFLGDKILLKHWDPKTGLLTILSSSSFDIHLTILKIEKSSEEDYIRLLPVKEKLIRVNVGYRGHVPPAINLDQLKNDKATILAGVKEFESIVPDFVRNLQAYFNEPVTKDGKFKISSNNGRWTIYDNKNGVEVCSLISMNGNNWAVVSPDGRFDASEGALKSMHYAYGLEVINLEQLKEDYYEPGLLQKLLGYSQEPLRPIVLLKDVKLYPEIVEQKFDSNTGKLTIKLKNRGGGIGKTEVFVNGKRVVEDARDEKLKQNPDVAADQIVSLTVDLSASNFVKGKENLIKVVTSNYLKEIGKGNIPNKK